MSKKRIAVPSEAPGGLEAARSDHFGHCGLFTIVEVVDGEIAGAETINNVAHGAGGCMRPVQLLAENGVDAVIVGGMGQGPLNAFGKTGIEVYFAPLGEYKAVDSVVRSMIANRIVPMTLNLACKGDGSCHH